MLGQVCSIALAVALIVLFDKHLRVDAIDQVRDWLLGIRHE
jgi:hypothetical protein